MNSANNCSSGRKRKNQKEKNDRTDHYQLDYKRLSTPGGLFRRGIGHSQPVHRPKQHREILTALNKPDHFILAIVEVDLPAEGSAQAGGDAVTTSYVRKPFSREPDFGVTSVNYKLAELLDRGEPPR